MDMRRAPFDLDESLINRLSPFRQLKGSEVREILDHATSRRYDAGAAVFQEAAPAEHFFLLLDGYIRVLRTTEHGEQVIVLHIPAGELFGFAPAVGRTEYPATAVAAAECVVLSWPTSLFDLFSSTYEGFMADTHRTVGNRMGEMHQRIVELSTLHVEQRVASALLRLVESSGRETERGIEIDFPLTRRDLAELTATTLHTVSRLLTAWERDGVVMGGRRRVVVCDRARLAQLANDIRP